MSVADALRVTSPTWAVLEDENECPGWVVVVGQLAVVVQQVAITQRAKALQKLHPKERGGRGEGKRKGGYVLTG